MALVTAVQSVYRLALRRRWVATAAQWLLQVVQARVPAAWCALQQVPAPQDLAVLWLYRVVRVSLRRAAAWAWALRPRHRVARWKSAAARLLAAWARARYGCVLAHRRVAHRAVSRLVARRVSYLVAMPYRATAAVVVWL